MQQNRTSCSSGFTGHSSPVTGHHSRGFTLIETLLALMISSILFLAIFSLLRSSMFKLEQQWQDQRRLVQELYQVLDRESGASLPSNSPRLNLNFLTPYLDTYRSSLNYTGVIIHEP